MSDQREQRNSLLRSSISIKSIRNSATQFSKSLQRSSVLASQIAQRTRQSNLFNNRLISKDNEYFRKRRENIRRKQREDELEASSITGVTKREGTVTAKSTKGFLGRILDFFGIVLIGWFVTKLPAIIKSIGNIINLIKRAVGFLTGFIDGVKDFLTGIGDGIRAAIDALPKFDYLNFKNESDKTLKETEQSAQKLDQDLFFATKQTTDDFNNVASDFDLDPDTGELYYGDEIEQEIRKRDGRGVENNNQEQNMEGQEDKNTGDGSNVQGTGTNIEEEEIKLGDDETNKKIEEEIGKLKKSGIRLENTKEDPDAKRLGDKIAESTAGVGAGGASDVGSQSGGTQSIADSKNEITDKNLALNDKKENEIEEEETEGEKGEPIINKRGRIIGYKKLDPAQVTDKGESIASVNTSDNERLSEFQKKKLELINQKKYGGTGRPITISTPNGDVTVNPGEEGYLEAFVGIVPVSKLQNNLEMTNKKDRPTIIIKEVASMGSNFQLPSVNSGKINFDNKKPDTTLRKLQTLILDT